jgi:hypothetical protein
MTIRYVAFIEKGYYAGFCRLANWPFMRSIDPDIEQTVEFDGPDDVVGSDVDVRFEELRALAEEAVDVYIRKLLGQ